jgi:tRNA nucleotidyltransferase (CCA-adding enzyme)
MHDIAKSPTKRFSKSSGWTFHGHDALGAKWTPKIFRRLGLPLDDRMKYVKKLVRLHLRPIALVSDEVSDSAVRRLIYEAGDDIEDLMRLCRADITSKNEWRVKKYRNNFDRVEEKIETVEEKDKMRNWKNPISGEEIMRAFDVKPGPIVGKVKDDIKEAIFEGDISNSYEAAYNYMMSLKEKYTGS